MVFGVLIDAPIVVGGYFLMLRYRRQLPARLGRIKLPTSPVYAPLGSSDNAGRADQLHVIVVWYRSDSADVDDSPRGDLRAWSDIVENTHKERFSRHRGIQRVRGLHRSLG